MHAITDISLFSLSRSRAHYWACRRITSPTIYFKWIHLNSRQMRNVLWTRDFYKTALIYKFTPITFRRRCCARHGISIGRTKTFGGVCVFSAHFAQSIRKNGVAVYFIAISNCVYAAIGNQCKQTADTVDRMWFSNEIWYILQNIHLRSQQCIDQNTHFGETFQS